MDPCEYEEKEKTAHLDDCHQETGFLQPEDRAGKDTPQEATEEATQKIHSIDQSCGPADGSFRGGAIEIDLSRQGELEAREECRREMRRSRRRPEKGRPWTPPENGRPEQKKRYGKEQGKRG